MTTLTVINARSEDIDELLTSVAGLFEEDAGRHDPTMDLTWPAREGRTYYSGLLDDPACLLLLARAGDTDGDATVGHLVGKLSERNAIRTARVAVLESLRVAPHARGQGVGNRLVDAFLDWARTNGAVGASVTAYAANDGAQRFYARHGFAPISITMRLPLQLHDRR